MRKLLSILVLGGMILVSAAPPATAQGRRLSFIRDAEIEHIIAGFAEPGEGINWASDGAIRTDGKLPISTMGGLKGRGHPVGATGVYQIVEAVQRVVEAFQSESLRIDVAGSPVVMDVIKVREIVWFSDLLTTSTGEPLRILRKFSRMRSKATTESFSEYPAKVSSAVTSSRVISMLSNQQIPRTTRTS